MAKALIIAFAYTSAMHVLALAVALCSAHPVYRLESHASVVAIRREVHGYYRADERVWFFVSGPTSPRSGHAAGHRTIAERYARESGGTVSGMGTSASLARRALAPAAATFVRDSKRELEREERSYDRVTDDGRAQERGAAFGYPSGRSGSAGCGS